jgi:hypothetical protein
VRKIAFALFLDGGVTKAADRGTQLLIASFRIRKDFVSACSKASPSASKVFWRFWPSAAESDPEPWDATGEIFTGYSRAVRWLEWARPYLRRVTASVITLSGATAITFIVVALSANIIPTKEGRFNLFILPHNGAGIIPYGRSS